MKDKKLFIEEDLQSMCKVIDGNIDTVKLVKSYCYEVVAIYYKDSTKHIVNVAKKNNGLTAIDVLKSVTHNVK